MSDILATRKLDILCKLQEVYVYEKWINNMLNCLVIVTQVAACHYLN